MVSPRASKKSGPALRRSIGIGDRGRRTIRKEEFRVSLRTKESFLRRSSEFLLEQRRVSLNIGTFRTGV